MSRAIHVLTALALCAVPMCAVSECKLVRIAQWDVQPQTGKLIVEGQINGQKIGVLVDTGAKWSTLLRGAANRLGLTRYEAPQYRVYGIGGETHAEFVTLDEFKLGQATRHNWKVLAVGENTQWRGVDFLLGYDYLEQIDVEFDLANNAVRIHQPQDCGELPLAYWARGTLDVVKLDFDNVKPAIRVPVKLNGKSLIAELDSGAPRSLVSRLVAAQLGVTPDTPGTRAAGTVGGLGAGRPDNWIGAFESFTIGGEIIRNPDIMFTDLQVDMGAETGSRLTTRRELADMLLGLDFLRAHRVYVAHSQGKLYFTYSGGPVFSTPARAAAQPAPKPDI
ncbi:MAG TPA: retroviral-like aspartic protease family protein [Burkholderiales bacterium]|nr:retroviral-like aspartic protease family protein [Burkholderiales bacterium]